MQDRLHISKKGVKLLLASTMTRLEFNSYSDRESTTEGDGSDKGCIVEFIGEGSTNHPNHNGYISWWPIDKFNDAYEATVEMLFDAAKQKAERGYKVARKGWNDDFACIVPENHYPAHSELEGICPAHWALKTSENNTSEWTPIDSDKSASDWVIVE